MNERTELMRHSAASLALPAWVAVSCYAAAPGIGTCATGRGCVNSLLGDRGFIEKFGMIPDSRADEDLRIRTHLEYVEKNLRSKNNDSWESNALLFGIEFQQLLEF
jgi:hypothetical protein